ncbi:MAG: RNA methyltransferase [Oscillospiraceae bacterium]|nr:RNA methyltransferase [Oscillospiraceae bacterium]
MEVITARKNTRIRHFRQLGRERSYRRETGLFLCDGEKLLTEAIRNGARIGEVLLRRGGAAPASLPEVPVYLAEEDAFAFASPLENSPGPLFSVYMEPRPARETPRRVLVLENVQDPGNVGTVLRTAAALGTDLVVLTGSCADPWQPKTVRAAMGALFRQPLWETDADGLLHALEEWGLPLYGAALAPDSRDIRDFDLSRAAVAVGNEGNGLSADLLSRCGEKLIIPMTPGSESLNAAVAASVLMWEMARGDR